MAAVEAQICRKTIGISVGISPEERTAAPVRIYLEKKYIREIQPETISPISHELAGLN
ncbi:MAG: hypothetical protein R3C41_11595 [Calditrichia bacterium]